MLEILVPIACGQRPHGWEAISHYGIIERLAWEWMGVVYDADATSFSCPRNQVPSRVRK